MTEQELRDELKHRLDRIVAVHRAAEEAMQPALRAAADALRVFGVEFGKAMENACVKSKATREPHADGN